LNQSEKSDSLSVVSCPKGVVGGEAGKKKRTEIVEIGPFL